MITWIALVVVILMLVSAVAVLTLRNMVGAVVAASVVSLAVSVLFVLLRAPDVAMTEAAVGAGLSGVVLALGLRRLGLWRLEGDRGERHALVPTPKQEGGDA
jgi:energy-converting hydrogenase B subunit D